MITRQSHNASGTLEQAMGDVRAAIEALQRAREAKLAELRSIDQALEALGVHEHSSKGHSEAQDFADLGITAAAKQYLREAGGPQSTREIADALTERGVKTQSRRYIATVYATLHNSAAFRRTADGTWEIAEPAAEGLKFRGLTYRSTRLY